MNIMQGKTPRFRVRISRISEWDRTAPQGARFRMCGGAFGAFVKPQYEQFDRVIREANIKAE